MREIFVLVGRIAMDGYQVVATNLTGLDKLANKTANSLNIMGKQMERAGKNLVGLTAPIAAAAVGIGALAIKTGEFAEHLNNLSKTTGLSTDTLQEMQHIAVQAGVDFDTFVGSITQLTRQLPNLQKNTGPAHEALKRMGLSALDANGKIKDMNTLFPEIIKKLQGVSNTTERVALAQQVFGKSAGELGPILGMTSEAFAAQREEAHKLGLIMSGDALDAADNFGDSVDKLKEQFFATARGLASSFIPILNDVFLPIIRDKVIPGIRSMVEHIQGAAEWFNKLSPAIKDVVVYAGGFVVLLGPMLLGVGKALTMFKTMITTFKILSAVFLTNPLGLIITSIGLLITAGILLYKNWDFVKEKLLFAWDAIVYGVEQAVSYLKGLVYSFAISYLETIDNVTKHIPGLNKVVDGAIEKLKKMRDEETLGRYARKELRLETQLAKVKTEEMTAIVKKAAEATENHTKLLAADTGAAEKRLKVLELSISKEKEDIAATEKKIENLKKQEDIQQNISKKTYETLATDAKTSTERYVFKKKLLELEYNDAISDAKKVGADTEAIEKYYALKRVQLEKEEIEKKISFETQYNAAKKFIESDITKTAEQNVNQVFDLFSKDNQNKMALIDNETAKKKEAILASTMGEQEKQAAIANLETEADVRKKKLTQDEAKREKAQGIFNAIISTAEAVIKAWSLGPIIGPIMSGIAAAIGVAQIALISAQPIPEMAEGALVNPSPSGIHAIVGEGKQKELIMPMETGLQSLIDGVSAAVLPAGGAGPGGGSGATSASPGNSGASSEVHYHIGTLIADDMGLKKLERSLYPFRIADQQRKGIS